MKHSLLTLVFVLLIFRASGQETRIPETIRNIGEELAGSDDDAGSIQTFTDRLWELSEDPVNLNSGDESELARLFFLTPFQVKALADYTRSTGKIVSFNELQFIPGFDASAAEMIIPFTVIHDTEKQARDSTRLRNVLITNLTYKPGQIDTSFPGSPAKILCRYRFSAGPFSGGINIEKDQGEKFIFPGTISPDFLSANLSYTGTGSVKKIIAGDYSLKYGQGLAINTGLFTGSALSSQPLITTNNEVKPYNSTDENNFFRGVAAVVRFRKAELSVFGSRNNIDATLDTASDKSHVYIRSLYKTGLHNKESLLSKHDAVTESGGGGDISLNLNNLQIGAGFSYFSFPVPLLRDSSRAEKAISFSGKRSAAGSIHYSAVLRRILLSGELAANDLHRYAGMQTFSIRPSDRLMINILVWKYSMGYFALHGKGPASGSGSVPEQSILGNFTFEAYRHLFISGGFSVQHYPWLKYRCSSPSTGIKRELRLRYLPSEKVSVDCLYGYRVSMADGDVNEGIAELARTVSRSFRTVVRYSASGNLILTSRFDYRIVSPQASKGLSLLQDLNLRFNRIPLTVWVRYCIFRTDDYSSRIYTYENDLLYSFSIPAIYGKGSRSYFMAAYKFSKRAELRFKYGVLTDCETAGSYTDTEEFRIQLRIAI
jgi:hypothetical protein